MHTVIPLALVAVSLVVACSSGRTGGTAGMAPLGGTGAAAMSDEIPTLVEGVSDPQPGTQRGIIRSRMVRVRMELITPGETNTPVFRFAPFADVDLRLQFERFEAVSSGSAWVGHAAGQLDGSTRFILTDGAIAGNVRNDAAQWHVRTLPGGAHVVEEIDVSAFPPD